MGADRAAHVDPSGRLQAALVTGAGRLAVRDQGGQWLARLGERFGPWHTVYMPGRLWIDKGALQHAFAELQRVELETQLEQREPDRPLRMSIDSTSVKVHQDGTGAPTKRGARRSDARAEV